MGIKGYSVGCRRKNVKILPPFKTYKRLLPNGNVSTIICGQSKGCKMVCTIISNEKPKKPCKAGSKRGKNARCMKY